MGNKRNTLKKIIGVSTVATVLPNSWVKPILCNVVLPAHAQTSQLIIDPIEDIVLDRSRPQGPEVDFSFDSKDGKHAFILNLISGVNLDPDAVLSITTNPTTSRLDIGRLNIFTDIFPDFSVQTPPPQLLLHWSLPFANPVPTNGEYVIGLKVTNPNGESQEVSFNATINI